VLLLSARAHLSSWSRLEVYRRSITPETVYKSIAILLFSSSFIFIITILLLSTQSFTFMQILFETVSAFGTVGLSMGITPELDPVGEILVSFLMYIGRVGPLSIALALGMRHPVTMEFPTTRIVVG
jgi:trk system potassium uptake protein TrkH